MEAARRFVETSDTAAEMLLVGDRREAVDDLAREIAAQRGAVFGLHRFSMRQLASRLASLELARRGLAPATLLNVEAVAARVAFDALADGILQTLGPIARLRSIGRTLAATLNDVRRARIVPDRLADTAGAGPDLALLAERYADGLEHAGLADDATLVQMAVTGVEENAFGLVRGRPVLLLDPVVADPATLELVSALARHAGRMLVTVPGGDERTLSALARVRGATVQTLAPSETDHPLTRVRQFLFTAAAPAVTPENGADEAVIFFSAPGEGRESVEIARGIIAEARRGVSLDRMAILLRSPEVYAGLLEAALDRAGVPAWFARGTRAPDPSGRAFLALLACAAERLSARRFSEYLSLAQVPALESGEPPRHAARWIPPASVDELMPSPGVPYQPSLFDSPSASPSEPPDADDEPVIAGSLRAPWRWDRLLVESAVIGGRDRWARRLDGLAGELELRCAEYAREEAESPRVDALKRDLRNLMHLRRFALPVIDQLAALPDRAVWGEWLEALETLAPQVLRRPDRVLAVLAELKPMSTVGPVALAEVRNVLSERLTELHQDPPDRRYGRVFVGRPEHARGRVFDVVFVPGLAERVFPQKQRQDPLLLDDARAALKDGVEDFGLLTQDDRATGERLLLRLAVGAATSRLYLSYPRLQLSESRPRVPSFYALDIERARLGYLPDFRRVERAASRRSDARLAWPAPRDPSDAIDDTEHDLAILGPLLRREDTDALTGRARYLLELNPGLRRSLLTRWARWQYPWSRYDGLYQPQPEVASALAGYHLDRKPYSVSALQRFAACPYQFLLSAIYRLEPREEIEALENMDPLTRGRLFHEVQAVLIRDLRSRDLLPVTADRLVAIEPILDTTLDQVAAAYYEDLAPAIDRVWSDEVESMRADLKGWLHHVADEDGEWTPIRAEFGFGFGGGDGRDPDSVPDPVTLAGKWTLHGVVDLIEARTGPTAAGELRVTDHKTGRNRTRERLVVGHGEVLQPVLYGLAVEEALKRPVQTSRLFYCTVTGEYTTRPVDLGDRERRHGLEVLEIIDRAVQAGILLPAPRPGACGWCDFRDVCGPWEETRVERKDPERLVDLHALRRMP